MTNLNVAGSPLTLLELPDDCLLHIFDFFDIYELLDIRQICQRFNELADRCRHKYENLDFKCYNEDEHISILKFLGPSLKVLNLHQYENLLDKVLEFCPNIEKLMIEYCQLTNWEIMRDIVKNVKYLSLINCEFTDNLGKCFGNASKLESLEILANEEITADFFHKIKGLKCLKVVECPCIGDKFAQILKNNSTLEELEISTYYEKSLIDVVKHVSALKKLKIGPNFEPKEQSLTCLSELHELESLKLVFAVVGNVFFDEINSLIDKLSTKNTIEELEILYEDKLNMTKLARLTNLKSLSLKEVENAELIKLQSLQKLEKLNLFCDNLTEISVFHLIKCLRNLKEVNCFCFDVSFKFVKDLIEMLKEKAENHSKLLMKVRFILDENLDISELQMVLTENRKILKLHYRCLNQFKVM
ncbi:uncharacterized protein LOC134831562 [Culicoides brevitarsis]|uniref:uncharacterized protein LOC134831562 n=1 Tax=Culicoides brevitarsis TaxID=469753 RepID=UPI00307BFC24